MGKKIKNIKIKLKDSLRLCLSHIKFSLIVILISGLIAVIFNFEGWTDLEGNLGIFVPILFASLYILIPLLMGLLIIYLFKNQIKSRIRFLFISFFILLLFAILIPSIFLIHCYIDGNCGWGWIGVILLWITAPILLISNYIYLIIKTNKK